MAIPQAPKELKLDRETFMLMRHRKLEAYEKAYEIEIIGLNELENEKDRILKEEMTKINEEYDKKKKEFETQQKIERSTKINECRVRKMKKRDELLEQILKDGKQKLKDETCLETPEYKELIKQLIIQGMIKLMEPDLQLIVVEKDKKMVEEVLKECEKEYEELMKKETERDYKCTLRIDDTKKLEHEQECGGITLVTTDGRIVCVNTIASKLALVYEQLLPKIRGLLFPKMK
eukprot:TRINITY_DN2492_c0_g1_i5.p1 TRINITY_DN2492_c0_g1~~TRINITY_DN2492_c0_g1_i5.p1  ORF type:complete len:233 (+),score=60.12 TRINITY_DN2492_c0_g1_i5:125-823(+)